MGKKEDNGIPDPDDLPASQERRYRSLFDTMPSGVAVYEAVDGGKDFVFREFNAAGERMENIRREDVLGRRVTEIFPGVVDLGFLEVFRRVYATGVMEFMPETRYFDERMGESFRENWVYRLPSGEIVAIYNDVTERVRAREERRRLDEKIRQAQKLESLGVLAGGIAHDFNNLLVGVLGNASLAMEEVPPASPARGRIRDIEIAARRASDLSKQMLAYSGRGTFEIGRLDLNALVTEMTHLVQVTIPKDTEVEYRLAPSIPEVEADATQIRQVVMNLVTNAADAIGSGSGTVKIGTGAMDLDRSYMETLFFADKLVEGVYVYIEVSDTGGGMDEQTRARIFEPFFTTKFTGRGLGLASVLGIVRGHRGAISVYTVPGRGSTFKVMLPAVHPAGGGASSPAGRPGAASGARTVTGEWRGSGTVLFVDDDQTVRTLGRSMLEHFGLEVVTAKDGVEAIEIFRRDPHMFALVVLDLTMPRMDGVETFAALAKLHPDVKVLLSSGYEEQEAVNRAGCKGIAGFVQKPYDLATIGDALARLLPRR